MTLGSFRRFGGVGGGRMRSRPPGGSTEGEGG